MSEFSIKEFVKQYENSELCAKWHNNIPLGQLNMTTEQGGAEYQYMDNSQDIDSICEFFPFLPREDITGAIVTIADGDYGEVYVTESSRPYDLQAIYHPLSYYTE